MRAKRSLFTILIVTLVLALAAPVALAGSKARKPAIHDAADRVVQLQRTDPGWEGTWYWYVGHTGDATNLTGVTALGLLEAYNDTKDTAYLDAAKEAAHFIMAHLGAGATGAQYHVRTTAPDVLFLHRLGQVTGDSSYTNRANLEWDNLKTFWPTAADLDALFHSIDRRSAWDVAFFLEAAHLSGDGAWAGDAAAILANTAHSFYYGTDSTWYALNLAGAVRALVGSGYGSQYRAEIGALLGQLVGLVDEEDGVGGYVQDTAYAAMAFTTVGGPATRYANDLARWLAEHQKAGGGWIEADGNEYAEYNGEALRALAMTIGSNNTTMHSSYGAGQGLDASWARSARSQGSNPFSGQ